MWKLLPTKLKTDHGRLDHFDFKLKAFTEKCGHNKNMYSTVQRFTEHLLNTSHAPYAPKHKQALGSGI